MGNLFFGSDRNTEARLDELDARLIRRDEVVRLLQAGWKIKAIKVYREDTGSSLADAKAAVERMMEQGYGLSKASAPFVDEQAEVFPAKRAVDMGALYTELAYLVNQRKKIEAIKLYHEQTGAGLRESKNVVDQIENGSWGGMPAAMQPPVGEALKSTANADLSFSEVERLVSMNEKIRAIKLYRDLTGVGLREAKEAVDQIENGSWGGASATMQPPVGEDLKSAANADLSLSEVERLVSMNEKLKAIKLYRDQTGVGLREAKEAIDRIEQNLRR